MNPEQWARVKDLFTAALEKPEADREELLERAGADDPEVRAEVQSLLAAHAHAGPLSVSPGGPLGDDTPRPSLIPGAMLGHYRIVRHLASGGMGDVYEADDTKLGRRIALKVPVEEITRDREWREQFQTEARAVAALNHPNIVTIHAVEDLEGVAFLTFELVDGRPLGDLIPPDGLPIDQVLNFGTAIAGAVGAAHAQGIVHRDLKPANVVVTREHRIKVLDFGLATRRGVEVDARTGQSRVVGTASYMSPEQAEGRPADERSDVFALGIVLFEMATGERPFTGASPMATLSSIRHDVPPLLSDRKRSVPPELSAIVARALEKDPQRRFQTANDVRDALARLQAGFRAPARGRRWLTAALIAGAVVSAGWLITNGIGGRTTAGEPFEQFDITRMTTSGAAVLATLSPDGHSVFYVVRTKDGASLWARHGPAASAVELVPAAPVLYRGLTVSPDGADVFYNVYPRDANVASLYRIATHGGTPQKIADDVDTPVSFSPDSKHIAFGRGFTTGETAIVIAGAGGSDERILARRKLPLSYQLARPAWSPDGGTLVVGAGDDGKAGLLNVVALDVRDGRERLVTEQRWTAIRDVAWLAGGRLLINAVHEAGTAHAGQIWSVAAAGGETRRVTNDLADYGSVAASADSRTFVTVQSEAESYVWIADSDGSHASRISSDVRAGDGSGGLAWTPDGKIVFASAASGKPEIWMSDPDGTHRRQLTNDSYANVEPALTSDGRFLLSTARPGAQSRIVRTDLQTGEIKELTRGDGEYGAMPSPDGRVVYFGTPEPGRFFSGMAWKVSIDGGTAVEATAARLQTRALSPDGAVLVGAFFDERARRMRTGSVALPGPAVTPLPVGPRLLAWTPDGRLTFPETTAGVDNIWRLSTQGGPSEQLTHFDADRIIAFAWSPNGTQLAVARGRVVSDVVMMTAR